MAPGQQRRSIAAELAAAATAAGQAGLGPVRPELLHLGNHTSIRLHPRPVVARVASGASFDFSQMALGRELALATALGRLGAPSVRPAADCDPGPFIVDGCAVTLWAFVPGRAIAGGDDERQAADALRHLHRALGAAKPVLPPFTEKLDSCAAILGDPARAPTLRPGDRQFLGEVYDRLRRSVEETAPDWRPLHGDAHPGNVLIGEDGATWLDLESACLGPLEWDVASLPAAVWDRFEGVDGDRLELMTDVRHLCVSLWCWAEHDRSAASAEAARHHLGELRSRF